MIFKVVSLVLKSLQFIWPSFWSFLKNILSFIKNSSDDIDFLTATSFATKNKTRFHKQSKNFEQNKSIASNTKPTTAWITKVQRRKRKKANKILSKVKGHAGEYSRGKAAKTTSGRNGERDLESRKVFSVEGEGRKDSGMNLNVWMSKQISDWAIGFLAVGFFVLLWSVGWLVWFFAFHKGIKNVLKKGSALRVFLNYFKFVVF